MAKVRVGFFALTEITDPGEHRAYNAWHQLDHMPEQYPLRGIVHGQRWVSTPACRAARAVDGGALAPAHYLTVYLMADPVHETLRDFQSLATELHMAGRFHGARRARLAGPFERTGALAAPRVLVSAEAVPYRPTKGVYLVVRTWGRPEEEGSRPTRRVKRAERDATDSAFADALVAVEGVSGVWSFASNRRFDRHGWTTGEQTLTVCYLDEDPLSVAPSLDTVVRRSPSGVVTFAGPFETVVPWQWDWFDEDA